MRPSEPPPTVKSWLKAATGRPSTKPVPVTTPSPATDFFSSAEIVAIVFGMQAEFLEGAGFKEIVQPVARGHQTFLAAGLQLILAATALTTARFFPVVERVLFDSHKLGAVYSVH